LVEDTHRILAGWMNDFSQLLNMHVCESSIFEFELAIEKLKSHKSQSPISVNFLVYRQIVIHVGDVPHYFILDIPGHKFCILFCKKDSTLVGQYALVRVQLAFPCASRNAFLTCLQAVCVCVVLYILPR
jgi:hypothetical protein